MLTTQKPPATSAVAGSVSETVSRGFCGFAKPVSDSQIECRKSSNPKPVYGYTPLAYGYNVRYWDMQFETVLVCTHAGP